ncbi:histidine kinase N-terminal 7TM domain-containing protein [Jeotgalibacillus proteolyticus]|uniref:histidine kinase N-terminal 7TM domain-containing diguanylate cyclase n=1 Tax=Jeotgalibacillus proteolyticus TaxID=2082395 RepID=UPI003CED75A5
MNHEALFYITVVVIAGVLSLFLSLYTRFIIKDGPGVQPYFYLTLFSSVFTFAYALELASPSLEQMRFWLRIEYLALPFIPVFTLLMCLEYAGKKIPQWISLSLFVIPIMTIFFHNTNELHHFYYSSIGLQPDTPFPVLKLEWGPWFYVHSIFVFLCLMYSIIVLILQLKQPLFRFRMQIITMAAGLVMPIIANHFYLNGLSPHGIDLGPVSMSASFLFHGAAILSYQVFNVSPIARETVFENMRDGVMVINQNGVLMDFNETMKQMLPVLKSKKIGSRIEDVLRNNPSLLAVLTKGKECEERVLLHNQWIHVQIRFSPLWNKTKVIGQIITFADITDRVHIQEKLQYLASTDGLTKLFNRCHFHSRADDLFNRYEQEGGVVAIVMVDIDHFKSINDTFGHITGDAVLQNTAKLIKECLTEKDIIGRYGGEEFIVCLPERTREDVLALTERMRNSLMESSISIGDKTISVTASFGVSAACISPGDESCKDSLIQQADTALYEAKRSGRNRVILFEEVKQYN